MILLHCPEKVLSVWSLRRVSDIKLSVCIATLNRGKFIGQTLHSIISQATDEVEIVVLDGASTDNTSDVVGKHQEHFPRLRYFRQDKNMGVDHDFAEAVRLAEGDYCWLFSDDDLVMPGAIRTVLGAIEAQYGLIIANAEVRAADLSKVLETQRLPLNSDRVYSSDENSRFFVDVGNYLTFIGGVIIRRDLWNEREKDKYFGSCFIHVGVIFQKPLSENALVISRPLITIRNDNASWFDKYFETWMFKWPDLIWSFDQYPDSIKLRLSPKEPWRKTKTLLLLRARGRYTINIYRKWLEPRLDTSWARAKSKTIAYFPVGILNFIALIYCLALSRHLDVADLKNSPYYFFGVLKSTPIQRQRNSISIQESPQPVQQDNLAPSPLEKNGVHLS
jgi:abequosyltransferase